MNLVAAILIAYLIGSISFAVLVSRAFGLPDPHTYGSGNPGATNVLRTGKKAAAVLTLLGDALKGWFAVMLVQQHVIAEPLAIGAAAVAVAVGHMYPVFHRFQGGKGVATALGVLLALDPYLAAGTAATWLIIAFFFRISSLAALAATILTALLAVVLALAAPGMLGVGGGVAILTVAIAILVVLRHRANIARLLRGEEPRLGRKATG